MFNINPKKMQAVMRQLGIKQEEIEAKRVIIEKPDGKIIIEEPSVIKVVMQGQETFQVSGNVREEAGEAEETEKEREEDKKQFEKDIETIMEKTGCSKQEAKEALEKTNDLAEAILSLS